VFDIDTFLGDCEAALAEPDPRLAVRDLLDRALADPGQVAEALPPVRAGITRLHVSDTLTVLQFVWGPHMTLGPHDHRMWAVTGIYTGGEDNTFFRRSADDVAAGAPAGSIVESGGRSLRPGDVAVLGREAVHAVHNPTSEYAGAIHVYGGDFFGAARSEWDGPPYVEQPFDLDRVLALFEASNA